jgi:SGNH hydrolase-like domain, acetyltransferase AlgX
MDAAQLGEDYRLDVSVERGEGFAPRYRADVQALRTPTGLSIFGWVVGEDETVAEVELVADGLRMILPVDVERPDVVEALGLAGEPAPGFYSVLQPAGVGRSRFSVFALGADGERSLLARVAVSATADSEPPSPLRWTPLIPPPEREKVLVGKSDWLFLIRDSNDVIGQQTGRVQLGEQARQEWKELLLRRLLTIKRAATTWHTLVIPDKEIVYPEYLPEEIVPAETRPVHEVLAVAEAVEAPFSYALEALQEAKRAHNLYPRTDSHWNYRGSLVAHRHLCDLIAGSGIAILPLDEDEIEWSEPEIAGGLGGKMHPPQISPIAWAALRSHRSRLVFDNQVVNHGRVTIFEQEEPGPTCVLFGESFAQHLVLFLKESFRRLVYVHTSMLVEEIIEVEHPDVVISLPVERFLIKVPDDGPGLRSLAATAARKAESGTVAPEMAFVAAVPRLAGAGGEDRLGRMPWRDRDVG